jgi:hypothetical protein
MGQIKQTNLLIFEELENGNLKISLTEEGKKELGFFLDSGSSNDSIWYELLEESSCNGSYAMVDSYQTGDLTESPIIVSQLITEDDGEVIIDETIEKWWFPAYMVTDELTKLLNDGEIIFTNSKN